MTVHSVLEYSRECQTRAQMSGLQSMRVCEQARATIERAQQLIEEIAVYRAASFRKTPE